MPIISNKYKKPIVPREPYESDLIKRTIKKMLKSTKKKKELLDYLMKYHPQVIKTQKIRERIENCCNRLIFRRYPNINKTKLKQANFCNYHKICLACATKRAILMTKKLYQYIQQKELTNKHRYTMVLTIRHNKSHSLENLMDKLTELRDTIARRMRNSKRLSQKSKSFFSQFDGVISSLEVTNGKYSEADNGRHPHIHLVSCSDIDIHVDFKKYHRSRYSNDSMIKERGELTSKWKNEWNDSFSVNIEKINLGNMDMKNKKIMDVFKYAVKAIALDTEDHAELIALLHRKKYRLYVTSGIFYWWKLEPKASDFSNREMWYIEKVYEKDNLNNEYKALDDNKIGYIKVAEKF